MVSRFSRRTVLRATGAGGLAALAGCTGTDDDDDTFRFTVTFFPPDLDPLENDGGGRGREVGYYESLFTVTEAGEVEPQLATGWELSDDDLTWEFGLRDDVVFHNGESLTAEAVVFSLERVFFNEESRLGELPVESVEAVDDLTVAVTTESPFASLPGHLARPGAAIIHPDSVNNDEEFDEPIATGPFQFESWDPDAEIVLSRHEEYYGEVASIERAVYERIDDPETELLSLQGGELDLARDLPNSAIDELEADDAIDTYTIDGGSERIFVFNTDIAPLDEREVRQAICLSLDREAIVETALDGVGAPAYRPWDPETVEWANPDAQYYDHDPDAAESLLTDAGWELDGDTRTRDGEELNVELWAYTDRPNLPDIAEAMQAQLAEVGISSDVRVTEWATLDDAKQQGDFEIFVGNWGMFGSPPDPDVLSNFYHPDDNILDSPYDNPDVTELLEEGRQTFDDAERQEIYDDVQELVMEDASIGFIARETFIDGATTEVSGYDPDPLTFELGLDELSM